MDEVLVAHSSGLRRGGGGDVLNIFLPVAWVELGGQGFGH